jgi:hypothetical protein
MDIQNFNLLIENSEVLKTNGLGEQLKEDQDFLARTNAVDAISIFNGDIGFESIEACISTINFFFMYDVDKLDELITHLRDIYVYRLRNIEYIKNSLVYPAYKLLISSMDIGISKLIFENNGEYLIYKKIALTPEILDIGYKFLTPFNVSSYITALSKVKMSYEDLDQCVAIIYTKDEKAEIKIENNMMHSAGRAGNHVFINYFISYESSYELRSFSIMSAFSSATSSNRHDTVVSLTILMNKYKILLDESYMVKILSSCEARTVKYALEACDYRTCNLVAFAAANNTVDTLEVLKVLIEDGQPLTSDVSKALTFYGQIKSLKYVIEKKCPFTLHTFNNIFKINDIEIFELMSKQGGVLCQENIVTAAKYLCFELIDHIIKTRETLEIDIPRCLNRLKITKSLIYSRRIKAIEDYKVPNSVYNRWENIPLIEQILK